MDVLRFFTLIIALTVTNVLGQTCDIFSGWDDYLAEWENLYYLKARSMYPYLERYCDISVPRAQLYTGFNPGIEFDVPFYGAVYKGLWVSHRGFVALGKDAAIDIVPYVFRESWPNNLYPSFGQTDTPFIAPFYAEADFAIATNNDPARMFYRVLDPRSTSAANLLSITEGMLERISSDVRAAVIGAEHFLGQYGIIITWHEVGFLARTCTIYPVDKCQRNTYQMALITDGTSTYTVFNFYNMTWVGSAASQMCNANSGDSFGAPDCKAAHVGFNAGKARGFTPLPYSGTDKVAEYDTLSGSNIRGRWYFDVTGEVVRHGGCTNDTNLGKTNWPLVVEPQGGPMLGGNLVTVGGPCFTTTQDIVCNFGGVTSRGIRDGLMRAHCVAPRQFQIGLVDLEVSVQGGTAYYFKNKYLVERQEMTISEGSRVTAVSANGDWLNPASISLTWDPSDLPSEITNRVTIKLVGYKENNQETEWKELYTVTEDYSNQGSYQLSTQAGMCREQNDAPICSQFSVAAFRVSINEDRWNPASPRALWSGLIPLGWFTKSALVTAHGEDWAHVLCKEWHGTDVQSSPWRDDFDPCPCVRSQAHVDIGRFVPVLACKTDDRDGFCQVHQGADSCYQATRVAAIGGASICCYDSDDNLMYAGDSIEGSFLARSSPSGRPPWGTAPHVPTLSHWIHDLFPYYLCCKYQTDMYDCFSRYMVVRPTKDCIHYTPPGIALAYGDPHFITFDQNKYTFNGHGEFWLMRVTDADIYGNQVSFSLQARMEQPEPQSWGFINGTIMTAAAMKVNNGPQITLDINKESTREHIMVRIDSRLLNFSQSHLQWQEFDDMIIINNDPPDDLKYSNFTVSFRVGVGVTVSWKNGLLHCHVTASSEFMEKTGGLLGTFNNDPDDDFHVKPPSEEILPPDSPPEDIFNKFGLSWRVLETETLFTALYRARLNRDYYNPVGFIPVFEASPPPGGSINEADVNSFCGSRSECRFDYLIAQSRDIAEDTVASADWHEESVELGKEVLTCGWLEIPNSIKREPVSYMVGSVVTITGCRFGFQPEGLTKSYTCRANSDGTASWSPGIGVKCVYTGGGLTAAMISIIVVPTVVGACLIIIGLVFLCLWCRKRRKKKEQERKRKHADQEEFQDLDVIGYGKSNNMFYNPNNPVVTNQSRTTPRPDKKALHNDTTSTAPIQQSTPRVEHLPDPKDTMQKKIESSVSSADDVFFDKESIDGAKIRSDSMHSMDRLNHANVQPPSPPNSDRVLLPESPKNSAKFKKKRKKEKRGQSSEDESDATQNSIQYSETLGGRPSRPALGAAPPSKPKGNIPAPGNVQAMQYQPAPVQQAVHPPRYMVPMGHPATQMHPNSGTLSDSSASSAYYQQDMDQFYRQNERPKPSHRPTQKARPYQYPTGPRNNQGNFY